MKRLIFVMAAVLMGMSLSAQLRFGNTPTEDQSQEEQRHAHYQQRLLVEPLAHFLEQRRQYVYSAGEPYQNKHKQS